MVSTKTLADALTAARFCLAGFIIWLGINGGAGALPMAAMALLLAWITDVLDGPLARRDPSGRQTWIGDHDLEVDMSVGFAVLVYLVLAGYLTPKAAIGYAVVCAALTWYFRSPHLGMAVQAPPYGGIIYAALRDAPRYGLLLVGYVILVVTATWPRFPQMVVPQFLAGMRDLGRSKATSLETRVEGEDYVENGNGNGQRLRPL
jgi:phosphatidylglycerophosphate synthase